MRKIIISCAAIFFAAAVGVTAGLNFWGGSDSYNENPDLSTKIVGSDNLAMGRIPITETGDLLKNADLVIVGEVISDGEEQPFNMFGNDQDFSDEMTQKGINPFISSTHSTIKVLEVINGEATVNSEIELIELGKPGTNDMQTKVSKGEKLVMMLRNADADGTYYADMLEKSMFYIGEDSKITSMSDDILCARYDGCSKDFLINDLAESRTD